MSVRVKAPLEKAGVAPDRLLINVAGGSTNGASGSSIPVPAAGQDGQVLTLVSNLWRAQFIGTVSIVNGAVTDAKLASDNKVGSLATLLTTIKSNVVAAINEIFGAMVSGSGTTNVLSKFTAERTLGDSQIFDDGTNVGIGITTSLLGLLHVKKSGVSRTAYLERVVSDGDAEQAMVELVQTGAADTKETMKLSRNGTAGSVIHAENTASTNRTPTIVGKGKMAILSDGSFAITPKTEPNTVTLLGNNSIIEITANAGAVVTLPPTANVTDGTLLIVYDGTGNAGTFPITLVAAAGDTFTGAAAIATNSTGAILYKRGTGWKRIV